MMLQKRTLRIGLL